MIALVSYRKCASLQFMDTTLYTNPIAGPLSIISSKVGLPACHNVDSNEDPR